MSQENYTKDVDRGTFIVELAPVSIVFILVCICIYITLALVFHILVDENFIIKEYLLRKSLLFDLISAFILAFIVNFLARRKIYRLMKEKPFAIVTNDRLILDFGRYSLSWDSVQSINIQGERKLNVAYEDKKRKKRICDLKWLSKNREIFNTLLTLVIPTVLTH